MHFKIDWIQLLSSPFKAMKASVGEDDRSFR